MYCLAGIFGVSIGFFKRFQWWFTKGFPNFERDFFALFCSILRGLGIFGTVFIDLERVRYFWDIVFLEVFLDVSVARVRLEREREREREREN